MSTDFNWNKIPRWMLVVGTMGCFAMTGIFIRSAMGDMETVKSVAYQAKNATEKLTDDYEQLKVQIAEVRSSQEIFRKEYREDQATYRDEQKNTSSKLDEITKAIYRRNG